MKNEPKPARQKRPLDLVVGRVLPDYADEWEKMPMTQRRFLARQEADWRSHRLAHARAEVERLEAAVTEANELVEAIAPNAELTRGEAVALNAGLCPAPTKEK